jgi:acetyl esterase/lipase
MFSPPQFPHWYFWLGVFNAAVASLAVVKAPTRLLWFLSVAVTEWGHLWAMFCGLCLLIARVNGGSRAGFLLNALAVALALAPTLRALSVAASLPSELSRAFGGLKPSSATSALVRSRPLSLRRLFSWEASRSGVRRQTVLYIDRDGKPLLMDIYRPAEAPGPLPGVLVVHGGSWRSGSRDNMNALNYYLGRRGYVVAAMDYRLAPAHRFPAARDDVQAAIQYLKGHAAEIGLDQSRLVILGRSAGGQLALLAGYTAQDPAIRGVVALYAPADLVFGYWKQSNPLILNSREVLETYLGGTPLTVPDAYQAASPIHFVSSNTPATLLIHGGRDQMVSPRHSKILADRLAQAGRPHLVLNLPWATHGCDINLTGPGGQLASYAIERFLAAVAGKR